MLFRVGKRVVEIRNSYIIMTYLLLLALIIFFGIYAEFPKGLKITYFAILVSIVVFSIIAYMISRSDLKQSMHINFDIEYRLMEFIFKVKKNLKNIGLVSLVFLLMFSVVFYVSSYGLPTINMPKISIKSILPEKSPSIESPNSDVQATVKETSTTIKKTTTTITTTTTTTTRKKPSPEGRKSGFYVYQKDVVYTDCSFDGKGLDAVLMPSGNYYCRSNEQRMEIKVDGAEKVCCITP